MFIIFVKYYYLIIIIYLSIYIKVYYYNFMSNNNWNLGALISSLLAFSYLFESTKNWFRKRTISAARARTHTHVVRRCKLLYTNNYCWASVRACSYVRV